MEYTAIIILVALMQFTFFTIRTGLARITYGVKAPSTAGHETWERLYRIQQNTMEQLIVFIPGMVIFAMYVSETWALLPGIVFIVLSLVYWQKMQNNSYITLECVDISFKKKLLFTNHS